MTLEENWPEIKTLFKQSFRSSLHFSIASISENGEPHVTPIGSIVLGKPGFGVFFEVFTKKLPKNITTNNKVCVLAVNSSRWLWIKSLYKGKFSTAPAIRLYGSVGNVREATPTELKLFQRRVKPLKFTKGHRLLWSNMSKVRDIEFSRIEPVQMGIMMANTLNHRSNS